MRVFAISSDMQEAQEDLNSNPHLSAIMDVYS